MRSAPRPKPTKAKPRGKARVWKAWGLFDKTGDLVVVKVMEKPYKCCGDDTLARVVVSREVAPRGRSSR